MGSSTLQCDQLPPGCWKRDDEHPGQRCIRGLEEQTQAKIEVEPDGTVTVSSVGHDGAYKARDTIAAMTQEVEVGRIYEGHVTEVRDFGAIVEIFPGQDGLVHISELDESYVRSVEDVVRVGDVIPVKVLACDDHNHVKLSRKQALRDLAKER